MQPHTLDTILENTKMDGALFARLHQHWATQTDLPRQMRRWRARRYAKDAAHPMLYAKAERMISAAEDHAHIDLKPPTTCEWETIAKHLKRYERYCARGGAFDWLLERLELDNYTCKNSRLRIAFLAEASIERLDQKVRPHQPRLPACGSSTRVEETARGVS